MYFANEEIDKFCKKDEHINIYVHLMTWNMGIENEFDNEINKNEQYFDTLLHTFQINI